MKQIESLMIKRDEAATMAGVSVRTLLRLAEARILPGPVRLGRCVRWHRDALQKALENLAGYWADTKVQVAAEDGREANRSDNGYAERLCPETGHVADSARP